MAIILKFDVTILLTLFLEHRTPILR
jgi:hypothetical protein